MEDNFVQRLQKLFDFASMAEIAREIDVPHATVSNYFRGRLPSAEVLVKIANKTNVSLNWLLTGSGAMYAGEKLPLDLNRILDDKIEELVAKRYAERYRGDVQELGTVDVMPEFDIDAAVKQFSDPQKIMGEWFRHEGREYPQDFGVIFFQGWESYSETEKVAAIRDAKNVLDRTLKTK